LFLVNVNKFTQIVDSRDTLPTQILATVPSKEIV